MVSPVYLIAGALGFAFLYPVFEAAGRRVGRGAATAAIAVFLAVTVAWILGLAAGGGPIVSHTAGFAAPLSIDLMVTLTDAVVLTVINTVALFGFVAMAFRRESGWMGKQVVLFFVLLVGSYGLVMTRDLFNVFVFMEISGIAVFGLLGTSRDGRAFEAGFKYMVASALASIFFLIGVAFVYRSVGSLNIADINGSAHLFVDGTAVLALVFLTTAILVELKPAPANGWALDIYEAADPGLSALLSAINATAMAMVLTRVLPLLDPRLLAVAGVAAFAVPHIQALRQESLGRMLGYSSVAQVGLVVLALSVGAPGVPFAGIALPAAIVLLLNHALAKAGLFWIASALRDDRTGSGEAPERAWPASLRGRPVALIAAAMLALALLGLPPFPGFWAKWNVVTTLGASQSYVILAFVLGGSLLEVVYIMRWLVGVSRSPGDDATTVAERIPADFAAPDDASGADADEEGEIAGAGVAVAQEGEIVGAGAAVATVAAALVLLISGLMAGWGAGVGVPLFIVAGALIAFALLDAVWIPVAVQAVLAVGGVGAYTYLLVPRLAGAPLVFALLFGAGGAVQMIAFLSGPARRPGLVSLTTAMIAALLGLTWADSPLALFVLWELMTISSFLLVLRGHRGAAGAFRYIVFSLGSAFLMLAAFAVSNLQLFAGGFGAAAPGPGEAIASLAALGRAGSISVLLLALAILTKLGSVGVHLWLPAGYAEAEDDVSGLLSSILSKAGVFLLFGGALIFAVPLTPRIGIDSLLGWIGVATAIAGAMMALFQEDIKYSLAYSSMSQVGYIVLAFAIMSHLGWVTGLYLSITHMLFKGMLFLGIAGVVSRTGTRLMYQMGGLIKRMPFSFISVLIAIIAVSGVPPLSGFGGKWLLYSALLERGWYLQAALALFSSGVAFLYLFRLIHTIFLGQRKAEHDAVREAPLAVLIPQYLFIVAIMAISMYPNVIIKPLQTAIEPILAGAVSWEGYAVITSLGYWNGNAVMYVTMGVFIAPLIWLLVVKGRVYRVEQFNIVYAAERPHTPQSTHYAYNFYGHYKKAFGRLTEPWIERFWNAVVDLTRSTSHVFRSWNTGNPQTYAFQIVLYLFLVLLFFRGVVL